MEVGEARLEVDSTSDLIGSDEGEPTSRVPGRWWAWCRRDRSMGRRGDLQADRDERRQDDAGSGVLAGRCGQ